MGIQRARSMATTPLTISQSASYAGQKGELISLFDSSDNFLGFRICDGVTNGGKNVFRQTPFNGTISGGIESIVGGYKVHTFLYDNGDDNGSGQTEYTLNVSGSGEVEYLVVAGGGGGGSQGAGGGGAGGMLYGSVSVSSNETILVGKGGAGSPSGGSVTRPKGSNGTNSEFMTFTCIGGGGGASFRSTSSAATTGADGGSGGGGAVTGTINSFNDGGNGTAGQGNNGGAAKADAASDGSGGGGGGAGTAGNVNSLSANPQGSGGFGLQSSLSGELLYYADGGGGGIHPTAPAGLELIGGSGRGGYGDKNGVDSGIFPSQYNAQSDSGSGGGGSGEYNKVGGNGGSGIVIVRYHI